MSELRVLTLDQVRQEIGDTSPICAPCHCRRPHPPLQSVDSTLAELRGGLDIARSHGWNGPAADASFETYRCSRCKGVAVITVRAVGLA